MLPVVIIKELISCISREDGKNFITPRQEAELISPHGQLLGLAEQHVSRVRDLGEQVPKKTNRDDKERD